MKVCRNCKLSKDVSLFYKDTRRKDGTSGNCIDCHKGWQKNWRSKNRRKLRNYEMRKKYGITIEQRDAMFVSQMGKCANQSCNSSATDLDHDHLTGKIRGILCHGCNAAIGHAHESREILCGLVRYLLESGQAQTTRRLT